MLRLVIVERSTGAKLTSLYLSLCVLTSILLSSGRISASAEKCKETLERNKPEDYWQFFLKLQSLEYNPESDITKFTYIIHQTKFERLGDFWAFGPTNCEFVDNFYSKTGRISQSTPLKEVCQHGIKVNLTTGSGESSESVTLYVVGNVSVFTGKAFSWAIRGHQFWETIQRELPYCWCPNGKKSGCEPIKPEERLCWYSPETPTKNPEVHHWPWNAKWDKYRGFMPIVGCKNMTDHLTNKSTYDFATPADCAIPAGRKSTLEWLDHRYSYSCCYGPLCNKHISNDYKQ